MWEFMVCVDVPESDCKGGVETIAVGGAPTEAEALAYAHEALDEVLEALHPHRYRLAARGHSLPYAVICEVGAEHGYRITSHYLEDGPN